ncbi:MAG: hypothetical protein WBD79_27225, partial [Anaerolineae bacterium]
ELVIAMGNRDKLRTFTLACAYGLVYEDAYVDPETNNESTEIFLRLSDGRKFTLSQSSTVRELDKGFANLPISAQESRLYLNALQNFMLKFTELPGFHLGLVERVKGDLAKRGVSLAGIENPFTLRLADVGKAIVDTATALGPSESDEPASARRQARNALMRLDRLEPFVKERIYTFKRSTNNAVRDMGTVMQLILRDEVQRLKAQASKQGL